MICFQTSGVGVNDLFRNKSLSKGTTLVLDSFAVSAVDDFGSSSSSSSSLLLIMLDLSMSKSMRKPSEYRLAFTSASAMLLSTCFTIPEVVSFDLITCYFSYNAFDFISQILQLSGLYFIYNVLDFTLVSIRLVVMLRRRNNNITSYTDSQTPAALTRYTSPRGITTSLYPPCNI